MCIVHYWDTHDSNGEATHLTAYKLVLERYSHLAGAQCTFVPSSFPSFRRGVDLPAAFLEDSLWPFDALWNRLLRQKPLHVGDLKAQRECDTWCPIALTYLSEALYDAVWRAKGPNSLSKVVYATMPNYLIARLYIWRQSSRPRRGAREEGLSLLESLIQRRTSSAPFLYGNTPSALDIVLSAFGHCFKHLSVDPSMEQLRKRLEEFDEAYTTYYCQQHSQNLLPSPEPLPPEACAHRAPSAVNGEAQPPTYGDVAPSPSRVTLGFLIVGAATVVAVQRIFRSKARHR